jgi:dynein heavy chain
MVYEVGLPAKADFIGDLSGNANKELKIEEGLAEIAQRWDSVEIDVGEYKEVYYKVLGTEDLFQMLEDDSANVSTMKASKFYGAFKERVDYWEGTLSTVSEVVESLLGVQRKWMYLESIFMAGEDIKKQLPTEAAIFIEVNGTFTEILTAVHDDPNAQRSCKADRILERINEMDEKLERIQKALENFLETKRIVFPRFYFISDDDLLEILGQSRDPEAVQKHVKKNFEGIKSMILVPPGKQGNESFLCVGMKSPDAETAMYNESVTLAGAVELWLCEVERVMQVSLQALLA